MTPIKALEFKGRMLSLTRVRILDPDINAIVAQLQDFARQMPQAVRGMPVVLEADKAIELGGILSAIRDIGMQPVAVAEGPLADAARNWGLAVLPAESAKRSSVRASAPEPAVAAPAPVAGYRPARIITEPVRSGQQIYAADTDLIVMNTVSAGAEVIADGCVHVYGQLRGRAVAGARGDVGARILCSRLEAELVAVAGVYAVAEQMQGELRGKPAQVLLVDGKLNIERLPG